MFNFLNKPVNWGGIIVNIKNKFVKSGFNQVLMVIMVRSLILIKN